MRLSKTYFTDDVLAIAPDLLGKKLVRVFPDGSRKEYLIVETEAYRGEEDFACHASKGRTTRTQIMYQEGGVVYVYLIYGMYWLLNIVTGKNDQPQAVLIRSLKEINGPGRVGKELQLDKSFYGEDLTQSNRLWIENGLGISSYTADRRVGIDYAGELWRNKLWRFKLDEQVEISLKTSLPRLQRLSSRLLVLIVHVRMLLMNLSLIILMRSPKTAVNQRALCGEVDKNGLLNSLKN